MRPAFGYVVVRQPLLRAARVYPERDADAEEAVRRALAGGPLTFRTLYQEVSAVEPAALSRALFAMQARGEVEAAGGGRRRCGGGWRSLFSIGPLTIPPPRAPIRLRRREAEKRPGSGVKPGGEASGLARRCVSPPGAAFRLKEGPLGGGWERGRQFSIPSCSLSHTC